MAIAAQFLAARPLRGVSRAAIILLRGVRVPVGPLRRSSARFPSKLPSPKSTSIYSLHPFGGRKGILDKDPRRATRLRVAPPHVVPTVVAQRSIDRYFFRRPWLRNNRLRLDKTLSRVRGRATMRCATLSWSGAASSKSGAASSKSCAASSMLRATRSWQSLSSTGKTWQFTDRGRDRSFKKTSKRTVGVEWRGMSGLGRSARAALMFRVMVMSGGHQDEHYDGKQKRAECGEGGASRDGGDKSRYIASERCESSSPSVSCLVERGAVIVQDDLNLLLQILPVDMRDKLLEHKRRAELLEVILDLGRRPQARFLGDGAGEYLREEEVTRADLAAAQQAVGHFGGDNRAGVEGTLHRISAIRNRKGDIVGLTCRVGRAVSGHIDMIEELLDCGKSVLFLGRPGVGKTTVIREMARVLSDVLHKRVVIVDTSNEIGGDGDVPHPAIGSARRMQVADPSRQHRVMVEAVENHMPQVVIVDEIGTEEEALACRTIAERGVQLIGTAHGQFLENLIKNPTLSDLVGGIHTVTLGDDEARIRGTQKSVLERKGPPTFPLLIEMRERNYWVTHQTDRSVDALLQGRRPTVETRSRNSDFEVVVERQLYDSCGYGKMDGSSAGQVVEGVVGSPRVGSVGWWTVTRGNEGSNLFMAAVPLRSQSGQMDRMAEYGEDATYHWADRIGYVPDKDAIAEHRKALREQGFNWHEDPGYDSSDWDIMEGGRSSFRTSGTWRGADKGGQTPGKRGSRRGPRGNMTGPKPWERRG
ncbi:hypothetical protein CBR_g20454 [Chara braunii]|uniref:AAA+ ATPase domain-containing protein n=1 Tax=Chara braunii TaxID=69332 RepID=A0A388JUI7_CHABU|nr:hypothetical protein CBR_g20454 [Chara braunii]|eukprot:GBG61423.1 hypothetical protein CBR_g20454 [Chara braunii]